MITSDDRGNVINFYNQYLDIGKLRKPSRYAVRAARYREYGDGFDSFLDFCYWDADPERSWNHKH